MTKVKKNLKDLVAASQAKESHSDSPYANLGYKFSPTKLQNYIDALSETEKEEYKAYCESPAGKREFRELAARKRRAALERANIRKDRIFNERFSKLTAKFENNEQLKERLNQAKTLTMDEIAQSLTVFPELLPDGHKAPALTLARKHMKSILLDKEKEYLMYVWALTMIPVDVCYNQHNDQSSLHSSSL